mmetsp:Transcript_18377/g.20549  ORF Transcript_18377/g.20549 Transcript_18377/m.20549 type:complete len:132 (+) Transcript_18377:248-643(+)|eukprot:CAMPEP_0205805998 /NCGR_PEP_ID=MMETSP0205-20121125/9364_1 /ASSEMBLY_ACC=CAM_ASM_000278 /TAXON_ID=36767 /ORGANISM="Euplotes focardii, Strain TN1" /LENGTH=131 /DNA_ID=CAMNT_0053078061 /DNA_START=267 /DNA_END=662 /DNA_ORIENTATION=-
MDWVQGDQNKDDYSKQIFEKLSKYKGFNLVFGQISDKETEESFLLHISNHNQEILDSQEPLIIKPGVIQGMSNGKINEWAKVELGIDLIESSLENFSDICTSTIEEISQEEDNKLAEDSKLDEEQSKYQTF